MYRFAFVAFVGLGLLWGCESDRRSVVGPASGPAVGPAGGPAAGPMEKQAPGLADFAQVVFTLEQNGEAVKDAPVELAYGDLMVMGLTDEQGQISFKCTPGNHQTRAWGKDDELLDSWPIFAKNGYRSEITLSTGEDALVTALTQLPPRAAYPPIPDVDEAFSAGSEAGEPETEDPDK